MFHLLKVVDHAHAVFCCVSIVQVVKGRAGVLLAFKTVSDYSCLYGFTIPYAA